MPCYVSFDLFYAVSPSSFLFPPLLFFRFLNVVPVLWFSVCTADQVTLFSFHFLILTPPPSSDWSMRGGCGLGGCRHLGSVTCDWSLAPFVTLHNRTHSPIHPCRRGQNMPQIPPDPPWSRPYPDAHLTSFALGAVCGRPKWRSKAPAQTLPLKT